MGDAPHRYPELEDFLGFLLSMCETVTEKTLDRRLGFMLVGVQEEEEGNHMGFVSSYEQDQAVDIATVLVDLALKIDPKALEDREDT